MVDSSPMYSGTPKALIFIPARFDSSRFPGKPLSLLGGKSMVRRVYENVKSCGHPCAVVTDDDRIEAHLKESKARVVRVDDETTNGTERIALAYERYFKGRGEEADVIVNVQGDEPLLQGSLISQLIDFHLTSPFDVATLALLQDAKEKTGASPHVVKVRLGEGGKCEDFFRDPPKTGPTYYQHIGVYSYRRKALERFVSLPPSERERREGLEQWRGLEGGLEYGAMVAPRGTVLVGIDRPRDLFRAQEVLEKGDISHVGEESHGQS
ncbi:MAG: NTP transferase domain-containing protein [Bacteriovoracales bacterium]|nr:NTP transferase domain-containing protein [Bacteriovoracales bacterium]